MSRLIGLILIGAFVLSACAPAASSAIPTEPATGSSAPAAEPTETAAPEATAAPEPTPTPALEPQPITADNAAGLALASVTDLGREFLADPNANWNAAKWTPDGAYVVVETDRGFDTLDGATLELVYSADGYLPVDMLADGRVAALMGEELVFINPATGEAESKGTVSNPSVLAVSADGNLLAYATAPDRVNLVTLASGTVIEITIVRTFAQTRMLDLVFRPDGQILFIAGEDARPVSFTTLINTADGSALYEMPGSGRVIPAPNDTWYMYLNDGVSTGTGELARPKNDSPEPFLQTRFSKEVGAYQDGKGTIAQLRDYSFIGSSSEWAGLYLGSYDDWNITYSSPAFLILFWNDTGANTGTLSELSNAGLPLSLEFNPAGSAFVTTDWEGGIYLWSRAGDALAVNEDYASGGNPALSPSGDLLAVPHSTSVSVLNSADLSEVASYLYPESLLPGAINFSGHVLFADAGTLVVTADSIANLRWDVGSRKSVILDISSGEALRTLAHLHNCRISGAGTALLCENFDNQATQVVRLSDGALLTSFKPADDLRHLRLSHGGNLLSSCREGAASITVQDLGSGGSRPFNFPCQDVLFLPGDTSLLLADGSLVDVETREIIGSFAVPAPLAEFPAAFFSPNGDFVLIGNQVYDLASGELLAALDGYETLYGAALAEDGLTLLLLTERGLERWSVNQ